MKDNASVVIVGSGVGGLTAAIILAKMGCRVTVVEKNRRPGGLMRGYSRQGVDCPVGIHYLCGLAENEPLGRVFEYLGVADRIPLERMGRDGVIDRYIFDDFTFDFPPGFEAFEANLKAAFPSEERRISVLMERIRLAAGQIGTLEAVLSPTDAFGLEAMQPSGEFMAELGCSKELTDVLGVSTSLVGVAVEECPVWLHHTTIAAYLMSSWRLKEGGAAMAEVYADRLRELGGGMIQGQAARSIEASDHRVRAVILEDGRRLEADYVVAAIHPKLILDLLPAGEVKPSLRAKMTALQETPGVFCVQAMVNASVRPALDHNVYRLQAGSADRSGLSFFQVRPTRQSSHNLLTVIEPSPYEDWRAFNRTVTGRRGPEYQDKKRREAGRLLDEAAKILGPLGEYQVLDAYSPLTLRDWVSSPRGATYGIKHTNDQMLAVRQFARRNVAGLYLSGQNLMAPGIMGTTLGVLWTVALMVGGPRLRREFGLSV
ncbi:MAG: FAD-dependent oxidoreductase [Thermodesulfobacteriota bacterium]